MATAKMTSGGRRDAREDVPQTSAPSMSPVEVWLYLDLFTTQPQHSTAMAASRTCLTRRAAAWTNCNWASMVNWIPPLIAATYRTLKTSGRRLDDSLVMQVWTCIVGKPHDSPQTYSKRLHSILDSGKTQWLIRHFQTSFWFCEESYGAYIWEK